MKPNKITTRTQVYRAIYYSSFNWERKRTEFSDVYTLKSKIDDFVATITHTPHGDLSDEITVTAESTPSPKDVQRLTRLLQKIQRRTKNMKFNQDIVDLSGQTEDPEVK
jgi:hypothetical protein